MTSYDIAIGHYFKGDPLRLTQILTNLLSNAVKFTHQGSICVSVSGKDEHFVRFEVRDTGIGISKTHQKNLFRSFSQADSSTTRNYGGTGLGLAISRQLVTLMHGRIWVESTPGTGTTFFFEIPMEAQKDQDVFIRDLSDKRVLIVDDSQDYRNILSEQVGFLGIQSDTAADGLTALEKITKTHYDLILMDWSMPGMDGIETTQKIQDYFMQCHSEHTAVSCAPPTVIMVSAFGSETVTNLAREAGIDIFLQKPVHPANLNNALLKTFMPQEQCYEPSEDDAERSQRGLSALAGSRILLVEDNQTNQDIILGLLENSGIQLEIAQNGKEAVTKYTPGSFDLILMDIQMPVMDGYQATEAIRTIDQNVPMIALTANAIAEQLEKAHKSGMTDYLTIRLTHLAFSPHRKDIPRQYI